jgi:hypothetical protein
MTNVDDYTKLCEKIDEIIRRKNLRIRVDTLNHELSIVQYDFVIINENSIVATKLTSFYSEEQVLKGVTRNSYNNFQTQNVFNITWLFTSQEYQKQKLALLILIYSICYLKHLHLNTKYVILDDDSDNNYKIKNNLYNKIGFVYRDIQSLASHNLLIMSGPEKQLLLNKGFIRRANDILSKIENFTVMRSSGGKYIVRKIKNKMDEKTVSQNKNDLFKKLKKKVKKIIKVYRKTPAPSYFFKKNL